MGQNANRTKYKIPKYKHDKIQKTENKLPKYKCNKIQLQYNTNGTKYKQNKMLKYQNTNHHIVDLLPYNVDFLLEHQVFVFWSFCT